MVFSKKVMKVLVVSWHRDSIMVRDGEAAVYLFSIFCLSMLYTKQYVGTNHLRIEKLRVNGLEASFEIHVLVEKQYLCVSELHYILLYIHTFRMMKMGLMINNRFSES